jgi:arsenate reductase (thioredoxin)
MKSMLLSFLLCSIGIAANGQASKVIFVCEHGAAKSVIAADYFNRLAKERGLPWQAVCRATAPDSMLNPGTRAGLKSDNIKPNSSPQKLSLTDTTKVKRIILFTALPKDFRSSIKVEDWSSLNDIDSDYSHRRDAIVKQINILLDSLEKQ